MPTDNISVAVKLRNAKTMLLSLDKDLAGNDPLRKLHEEMRADLLRDIAALEGGHVPDSETEAWRSAAMKRLEQSNGF